ncbi:MULTISPECIES: TetR/AcrR family transcriptional regulator [unclassified Thioalkalivibrio]|uniref:TetR/AcrR family transcriptional regulator n=1 Tax=unclassified Thioalkalivibrio TaxID=2621013 RepID=UPI00037AF876|nr:MULTISPECIES: TetR/AcrR family transcriptional regulator [unclassified Thioalkalivibrio]
MATDTRTRMIEATARLIQARGLHGVSLNDILEASGAPRGSLYFHFPGGKTDLVLEAVRAGVEEASRVLRGCLEAANGPAEGIRRFFQAAAGEMSESGYAFGCPVAPIVLDMPEEESALAEACQASFEEWMAMYRDALVAAGIRPARAVTLARTIISSLEGALILARSERNTTTIADVGNEMAALIENAMRS